MPAKRGRGNIDWSDAADLTRFTAAEIAEKKGCSPQAARRALDWRGFAPKPIRTQSRFYHKGKPMAAATTTTTAAPPKPVVLELKCKNCGEPLAITSWNNVFNMASCINSRCRAYQRPVIDEALRIKN